MNHIYRVIWSKVKHCYVVVSEIAKRNGKSSSKVSRAGITALALVGTISLGTSVYADNPTENSTLTADQQAVYKAVLQELTKNGVHYVSVKGTSQDADSNYNNDGAKGSGAVAIGEKALASKGGTVSIGRNAHIEGNGGNTDGEGSVAIGDNALITTNGLDLASIALGKNAKVLNGSGKQERGLSFTPDNFDKPGFFGRGNTLPKNADKVPGGIAIGTNTFARTGSIQLGHHTFAGYKMGGIDVTKANEEANIVGMTTVGTNTYNKGALANMYGAYSIITGGFTGEGGGNSLTYGPQNFGANVVGSLNSIRSKGHSGSSGIANSIVGVANTVENANGTLVYGAGNKISNSNSYISAPSGLTTLNTWEDTVTALQKSIKDSNSGGAVLAIGGGNVADYVRHSQLVGVNNTVTGTKNKVSEYNMVDGYKNTVTNGTHVTMLGSENTATDSESTLIMGDKQKVTKVKHGVLLGSQDKEKETTVSDIVAIGHNAYVGKEDGIALGSYSIASVDKGIIGYDPLTGKASTETSAIWKATKAALSIGSTEDKNNLITRQITGVAAGTEDTDAVNVAQLKALKKKFTKGINEMFGAINRVGAHSAALAALQPLDFDPYNRNQIMAGVSTYKGQQAIALGVAHYSNENTLVHAGLSYAGESDLMANVGISYKFGSEEDKKYLHERNKKLSQYKDGPISSVYILQDEVKQLLEENNGMRKEIEELKEKNAKEINELKAVIKEIQNKA